jgi:hypothetical protein
VRDDSESVPVVNTRFNERGPRFSPDGRWLAYVSDGSGRDEIWVQPYPGPGPKLMVSTAGGREPVWSPVGNELFYREDNRMMVVSIRTQPSFQAGDPSSLFEGRFDTQGNATNYDVDRDGQRFLMVRSLQLTERPRIHLLLNWIHASRQ